MKVWLRSLLLGWLKRLTPKTRDAEDENRILRNTLTQIINRSTEELRKQEYSERLNELIEARQMAGAGPWRVSQATLEQTDRLVAIASERLHSPGVMLREANPISAAGATGDIELALQNVEWRREVNLAWLEFSRWGIQQLILISRLHYIKHPWIQRAINIVAAYVFGRGVEVMSEDDDANDVLKEFFEDNRSVVGQAALSDLQKRLQYDGQVFFAFFPDATDSGKVKIRTIDATEIFEIVTDPDDSDVIQFYQRKWSTKVMDQSTGQYSALNDQEAYYPALNYEPTQKPQTIGGKPVMWDNPVYHLKGGTGVSKWHFDCPKAYAALDWAKAGRRWLEACATVRAALAQFAMLLTTKGGQQALEGAKQQLQTSIGPTSNLWDQNPPGIAGSTFASGPGTTLQAFNTKGAGGDPSDVGEYRAMVANVFEIPATWLGDYSAILATATTLDRPTELGMLEKQERWREALVTIATYVLKISQGATSGKLSESKSGFRVIEAVRVHKTNGTWVYEAKKPRTKEIAVKVIFPAIREGDMPTIVKAIAEAMTLDNKGGQVVGIDERVGVGLLYEQLGVDDAGDIIDEQYPPKTYDPDRTKEPLPPPVMKALPNPGGQPQNPDGSQPQPQQSAPPVKAAERLLDIVNRIKEKRNASGKHAGNRNG